ncbi:MAG: hemerythrin domain-containing protein [Cyclobacteriaceae bacterium]
MKRHPALISISREHHQLLLLAQLLKKDAPAYKGMPTNLEGKAKYAENIWDSLFKQHIELEEKVLYPMVFSYASSLSDLINELQKEHEEIAIAFKNLSPESEGLDRLGKLIEGHVRKEERVLFQQAQELLTEEQLHQLKTLLSVG